MGEEAFHEESVILDCVDSKTNMHQGVVIRQVYGDFDVHIGIGGVEHCKSFNHDWVDPDIMVTMTADEATELHGKLEQFLYARCERCDGPVDGSEGVPDEGLLCDDCADDDVGDG